jgi:hypothetical protein
MLSITGEDKGFKSFPCWRDELPWNQFKRKFVI